MINKMWQISRTIAMNYQKAFRDIARATFFNEITYLSLSGENKDSSNKKNSITVKRTIENVPFDVYKKRFTEKIFGVIPCVLLIVKAKYILNSSIYKFK